jgi:hypothetical protein
LQKMHKKVKILRKFYCKTLKNIKKAKKNRGELGKKKWFLFL